MMNIPDEIEAGKSSQASGFPQPEAITVAALLLVTFLAYVDTLALSFVFDDHVLIVTNESIRSWRYFPTYFTSHIWAFRYPHLLANYYRPLFLTWLRLNDAMFGLHAWGWHLTSVLAHLAVTYLVYRLALRLTRDRWVATVAGLIFGLHPVHAEAVADITSIQEPLSTIFILGAILAFARSRNSGEQAKKSVEIAGSWAAGRARKLWLAGALIFTAAALLSKESGMIVPVLIGCYAWIYGVNDEREAGEGKDRGHFLARFAAAFRASIPFWLVVLAYVPARVHALKGFTHIITAVSLRTEVFTIPSVLLFYLRLLVWPTGLSCYYDTPYVSSPTWHGFLLPALGVSAVALALGYWYFRTRRNDGRSAKAMELSFLVMLLTLIPVLNFSYLPAGEIAHDRYVYLPSAGFVILVALALGQARRVLAKLAAPGVAMGGILLLVMGYATARQNLFWADDLTLNSHAHEIAPNNNYAATSLAAAVADKGMEGAAMALYRQVLERQPNFWRANVNLAYLEYAHGNYPAAAQYFSRSCASDPTDGDQFLYLGMSLLRIGRLGEAENAVRMALLVRPEGKRYHLGLGMVLKAEGNLSQAKSEVDRELEVDPQNSQAISLRDNLSRQISEPIP